MVAPESLDHVREAVECVDTLIGFTASGRQRNASPRWMRVVVRPVQLGGRLHFQFSYFDGKQDITKNYDLNELDTPIDEVLREGLANYHVQTKEGDLHVRITKKGKILTSRGRCSGIQSRHQFEHNRTRNHLLTPDNGREVLVAVGILDRDGCVKPTMQPKYRQVNAFLQLLGDRLEGIDADPVRIVDCGCGSAFLALSAYAYLTDVRGRAATLVGVDWNERLIEKCRGMVVNLGWSEVLFEQVAIADYNPKQRPHIVLSLHACDTATDEALAQGVHWDADLLMAAPCCHQELSGQLESDLHRAVLRHGILKHRTAEILTDALRAQLLRIAGYRSEVIEFISTEETAKNLMIRAVKDGGDVEEAVREYVELKTFWGVEPSLEKMLGEKVAVLLEL